MLKKIIVRTLLVLALLILGFAVIVALQPSDYRIVRSALIPAPPATVFAQVNDFHNWDAWSPWAKLDPNSKVTFEGAPAGAGAIFKWSGNDKVGEGVMTVTESHPDDLVKMKIEFIRPFSGFSDTLFTFAPEAGQTRVTWTMSGKNNFIGKAFCLFMNQDKMIGGDFEKGLANLRSVVEKSNALPTTAAAPQPK